LPSDQNSNLGTDFHWRTIFHETPDLFDLLVGDGDAAVSPIARVMRGADEAIAIRQAVDVNIAAARDA
jgi:hypothetical protein